MYFSDILHFAVKDLYIFPSPSGGGAVTFKCHKLILLSGKIFINEIN